MRKLARVWYDNPDAQYANAINNGDEAYGRGMIDAAEFAVVRAEAAACRDQAKAENTKRDALMRGGQI